MPNVPNLPAINVPSEAAAYSPITSLFGALANFPQTQQAIESGKQDLEQKKLYTQQLTDQVATAKAQQQMTMGKTQLDAISQLVRSNPKQWSNDPSVIQRADAAYQQAYGVPLPRNADGSLPDYLYKPDYTSTAPQTVKDKVASLPPGKERDEILSQYSGVTDAIRQGPVVMSDLQKAQIAKIEAQTGHYINTDAVASAREQWLEYDGRVKEGIATQEERRKWLDTKQKGDKIQKDFVVGMRNADARLKAAEARMLSAQNTSGPGGTRAIAAASLFERSYKDAQDDIAKLDQQITSMQETPSISPEALQDMLAQRQVLQQRLDRMQPAHDEMELQLRTNGFWLPQAGTGTGTGRPPTVTDVGRSKTALPPAIPPYAKVRHTDQGDLYLFNGSWHDAQGTIL